MNTDTFWTDVVSVIYQTSLVCRNGAERQVIYLLSQDIPAIQDYAGPVRPKDSVSTVASRPINRFLAECF
jgi:hypothetical protein